MVNLGYSFQTYIKTKLDTNLNEVASNLAPAATALSTADWTATMAGYLNENVTNLAPASTALTTATWTGTAAGKLDASLNSIAHSATALSTAVWIDAAAANLDAALSGIALSATALSTAVYTDGAAANLDAALSGIALSATALSTAVWIDAAAVYLDAALSGIALSATALSTANWTDTRNGYLDNADRAVSTVESNIRGGSETLQSLSGRLDAISGGTAQTIFSTASNTAVAYVAETWTDIYTSGALAKDTKYVGLQITNAGTGLTAGVYRCIVGSDKVFPYAVSSSVISAELEEFASPIQVPSGSTFKVQVNCTATTDATATLNELDIITLG